MEHTFVAKISLDAMPLALEVEYTQLEIDTLDHFHRHHGLFSSNQHRNEIASRVKLDDRTSFSVCAWHECIVSLARVCTE